MYKSLHAATAVAALILAGAASADDTLGATAGVGVDTSVNLSTVDTDADGKVSKQEAQSNPELSKQFDGLDTDHDGNLSQAEFAKFEAKGGAKAKGKKTKTTPKHDSGATGTTSDDTTAPASSTKPGH